MNLWEFGAAILTALLGSGLIQFFINRNDGKKEQLDKIEKKLDEHIAKDEEDSIINVRVRILRTAEDLRRNGGKATKGIMDQAIDDCQRYDLFCEKHSAFRNGITSAAETYVRSCYNDMMAKNSFMI